MRPRNGGSSRLRGPSSFWARSRGPSDIPTSTSASGSRVIGPRGGRRSILEGGDVQHDLRLFVEDLSATARQAADQVDEPVLTVDEVSRRYNVSPRTVARWRRQGLVARRFVIGGRTKVGFLESSLRRFVTAHREQVERGSRFRQLTEAERDEIIRRARRMALVRPGQTGLVEIARRIARKMSRSTETIRLALKAYDREHPDRAIFPNTAPPLDDEAKSQIYLRFRMGVSAEVLARQYHRTRSSVYRVINEMRARRILGTKLEFIDNPSFGERSAAATILGPLPEPRPAKPRGGPRRPRGFRPIWAASTRSRSWTASRRCICSAR